MSLHHSTVFILLSFIVNAVQAVELVVLNWDEYLAESVIEAFEKETGHTIKQVIFDSDFERDQILGGNTVSKFDLVMMDHNSIDLFANNNILATSQIDVIDPDKSIDPRWRGSCHNFGLPYSWGTLGIAYRTDKITQAPTSWSDLMSPTDELKGHVGMMLDAADTLVPPLKLQNHSAQSEELQDLKDAYALLKQQKPSVLTYQYAITYLTESKMADELYMALVYSGDHYTLNDDEEDGPWQYTVPKEGTSIWIDCLAVLESSQNKQAAIDFLVFINTAEVAAENSSEIWFSSPNQAALLLLDEEVLTDETLYPPQAILDMSELYQPMSEANISQRNRIVNSFRR